MAILDRGARYGSAIACSSAWRGAFCETLIPRRRMSGCHFQRRHQMTVSPFMFATGIENSYPTIDNGRIRIDEMDKCGHYEKWRTDFDLVDDLGISFLRYGPPIHKTWIGEGRYYWEFTDVTFADLKRRDIVPIVDLCHFGVPDWVGNFQNPDFPSLFARYARDFAQRFPWVQLYTPVNEMFV